MSFFYKVIAPYLFFLLWVGSSIITFIIGNPGWHVGASGLIYGLAFFLFFSGIIRKHIPLIAISLLITFIYGGLIWNMLPFFAQNTTSWEGHLSESIMGVLMAFSFQAYGPQKPNPFAEKEGDDNAKRGDKNSNKILKSNL